MTFSRGTRQLSRISSQVEEARRPSLSSFLPTWKPGNSRSIRNAVTPLYPASGLALAKSRKKPASAALVIHSLRPLSRKWSPWSSARVAMAKASEPDPASDKRVGGHGIPGQPRQVFGFLFGRRPAQQRVVADRVLHIDNHAGRGVHRGEFLHREDGLEERAALSAVFLGDLDPHQAHFEELLDDVLAEDAGLVHLAHVGANLLRARTCAPWPGRAFRLRRARSTAAEASPGSRGRSCPKLTQPGESPRVIHTQKS